jgi:anthranilate phosphoribosyltransferase
VEEGRLIQFTLDPEDFGTGRVAAEELAGGDAEFNARRIEAVLGGERGPLREVICANAACALWVAGRASGLPEGFALAEEAIDSGAARGKLAALRMPLEEGDTGGLAG